jgi:hypothetical protein
MSQIKKCDSCGKIVDVIFRKYNKGDPEYSELAMQNVCEKCADKLIAEKNWAYSRLVD